MLASWVRQGLSACDPAAWSEPSLFADPVTPGNDVTENNKTCVYVMSEVVVRMEGQGLMKGVVVVWIGGGEQGVRRTDGRGG